MKSILVKANLPFLWNWPTGKVDKGTEQRNNGSSYWDNGFNNSNIFFISTHLQSVSSGNRAPGSNNEMTSSELRLQNKEHQISVLITYISDLL